MEISEVLDFEIDMFIFELLEISENTLENIIILLTK